MNENIKNYWENAHKNNLKEPLSGYGLYGVWTALNITDKLIPNIKTLIIGVGLGNETVELSKHKDVIIDVLDISENAINKVKSITRSQYLSSNISDLPIDEYDVVTCHLVNQHMNDEDFNEQVKYVLRSLNPDGVFALQFAFVENVDEVPQGEESQKGGGVIRKLSEIEKFVKNNSGQISWVSDVVKFPHTPARWQYVHIKRK